MKKKHRLLVTGIVVSMLVGNQLAFGQEWNRYSYPYDAGEGARYVIGPYVRIPLGGSAVLPDQAEIGLSFSTTPQWTSTGYRLDLAMQEFHPHKMTITLGGDVQSVIGAGRLEQNRSFSLHLDNSSGNSDQLGNRAWLIAGGALLIAGGAALAFGGGNDDEQRAPCPEGTTDIYAAEEGQLCWPNWFFLTDNG